MRENALSSIEEDGKFIGLPTVNELKLIMALSSNLNEEELNNISKKKNFKIKKYKLSN